MLIIVSLTKHAIFKQFSGIIIFFINFSSIDVFKNRIGQAFSKRLNEPSTYNFSMKIRDHNNDDHNWQ